MRRALRFLLLAILILAVGFGIATLPGTVTAQAGDVTVATTTPVAILAVFLLAVLATWLLHALTRLRAAPSGFGSWRGGRRRAQAEAALTGGITALAAGDVPAARAGARRALRLARDHRLAVLLDAEAAWRDGDAAAAAARYRQLAAQPETAFLGHRGLLRLAVARGDAAAAQAEAAAAGDRYPSSPWLRSQRLGLAAGRQDWTQALALTSNTAEVAAFAAAAAASAPDNRTALALGKQAVRADPAAAPGVVAYATALLAAGKPRAARRTLRAGWARRPNPLIAEAWLQTAATPLDRAKAAGDLAAANPGHPASSQLLAETAAAAGLAGEARRHAGAVQAAGSAQPGTAWQCAACGKAAAGWSPVCPACGRAGTLAWTATPA